MRNIFVVIALLLAVQSGAQTYNSTGGTIIDNSPNSFTQTVSGLTPTSIDSAHGLVEVCIDITHTYDADLEISLVSPDGTTINLLSRVGGGGDNFTGTCLNQSATTSIGSGSAPFTGTYKPMENIGEVNNGQNGNGVWTLQVDDTWAQDMGVLNSWSLTFGPGAPYPFSLDSSELPIVIIDTYGQTIPDEPKVNGNMKIIYNGVGMINYITDPANEYDGKVGVEIRGASSANYPQKPYAIETRDIFDADSNVSVFGWPSESDWVLISHYNDKSFMRNPLAYRIFHGMGHYSSRYQLCEVIINGVYQGIYMFGEKIKRDNGRVDIAKLDSTENTGDDVTGGYIFKTDYWDWNDSWQSNYSPIDHTNYDIHFVYHYPKPDRITLAQQTYLQAYVDSFETALYGNNFDDPILGYRAYIDVASFIDYLIINEVSRNNDGFKKSRYYHKDKYSNGGLMKAGPLWDFDWAWKNINECSIFAATDGSGWAHNINDCSPDVNSPGWYVRLMQDTVFVNEVKCRYETLRTSLLDTTFINTYIDSVVQLVSNAQDRHYTKWTTLGINVGAPEVGPIPTTFQGEVDAFKDWIALRLDWLDNNLPGTCHGLSVNDMSNTFGQVKVYPNPTNDLAQLAFTLEEQETVTIQLWSVDGRKVAEVYRGQLGAGQHTLPINARALAQGTYLIHLVGDHGYFTSKMLVKQ